MSSPVWCAQDLTHVLPILNANSLVIFSKLGVFRGNMSSNSANITPFDVRRHWGRGYSSWINSARTFTLAADVMKRAKIINICIILMNFIIVPLYMACDYEVKFNTILVFAILFPISIIFAHYYLKYRVKDSIFYHSIVGCMQLFIGSVSAIALSYTVIRSDLPLIDRQLDLLDKALGFDWQAYAYYIIHSPTRLEWAHYFYGALETQLLFVTLVSVLFLKFREYQTFLIAFLVSALITIVLSGIFPAYGAFSYYGIMDEMDAALRIKSGHGHVAQLEAIRAGLPFDPTVDLRGVITFPSFHACGGFLLAWLFWQIPYVRILMVPLNFMMILVTPLLGAHYLSDVIAGVMIGATVLAITKYATMQGLPEKQPVLIS
jgi:membrane-associated phospholipid phosphatase